MDALTLKATVYELNNQLSQEKIEKVFQINSNELIIKVGKKNLMLSCHPVYFSMHLTSMHYENPTSPSAFAMMLRKHLSKGRISSITMDGFERVITINVNNTSELFEPVSFKLMVELMGKHSNIILVDRGNKVLDSIKRIPLSISRKRQILPGVFYSLPPTKGDVPAELDDNYAVCSGLYPFTKEQLKNGVITVQDCLNSIESPSPNILKTEKKLYPMSIMIQGFETECFNSMSEMLDSFYSCRDTNVQNTDIIKNVTTILLRQMRTLELHNKSLGANEEKYKILGELLTSYAYELKQGKTADVMNYYTNEMVTIPLDENLTINENAQKYYKRYGKIKSRKIHAKEQIAILNSQIEYLENVLVFLHNSSSQKDIDAIKEELYQNGFMKKPKKKMGIKKLEAIKYTSSGGFEIEVGRNSIQNDELTTKKAKPTDLWFHTKDIPGSHVIVYTRNLQVDDKTILEAANIAACHSKAKTSSKVPVDYTLIKHVKKPAHSLPGKVIFKEQKTIFVTPNIQETLKLK